MAQKDRLNSKLTGFNTKGQEYKKVSNNQKYSGAYYVDLNTNKLYTDNDELLTPIKDIKQINYKISFFIKIKNHSSISTLETGFGTATAGMCATGTTTGSNYGITTCEEWAKAVSTQTVTHS